MRTETRLQLKNIKNKSDKWRKQRVEIKCGKNKKIANENKRIF